MAQPNQNPNNRTPAIPGTGGTGSYPSGKNPGGDTQNEEEEKVDPFDTEYYRRAYQLNPDDPNYVQNTAGEIRAVGSEAADAIGHLGVSAVQSGESTADEMRRVGAGASSSLNNLGDEALDAIAGYGTKQGSKLQGVGQQAAGAITDAAQGGAGELYDFAGDAAAAQAAAAGRTFNPLDFAAANQLYGQAGALGGQLAGLEAFEGPSAAQAQLQTGLNAAQQSNLALARSGRGWGGSASALSQAAVQNAMAGQQAANQSAMLRAQENAAWRQRQAANLGTAAGIQTALGQQMQGQTQFAGDLDLRRLGLNDQTALAYAGLGLDASKAAGSMGLEGAIAGGNLAATTFGQGAELGMRGLESGYGMNIGATESAGRMGLDALEGAGNMELAGYGAGAGMIGTAAGQELGAIGAANALYGQDQANRRGLIQDWLTKYGIDQGVAVQNAQMNNQMWGAGAAGLAALLPLLLASDRDAKMDISPVSGKIAVPPSSGQLGVLGPGGPAYDRAMASAARAERERTRQAGYRFNPFFHDGSAPNMYTMPGASPDLGMGLASALGSFGGALQASDENAKTEIQALRGQVQAMGGQPPAPMSQAGLAAQQTAAQPAPGGYMQAVSGGNLTPASRQLGGSATPGQTFTPTAQFSQQMGTPAAAPGQTFTASPQFTQQMGMPSPSPASAAPAGGMMQAQFAGHAQQPRNAPQSPWEYARSRGIAPTIGADGRSYAARPAAQGQAAAQLAGQGVAGRGSSFGSATATATMGPPGSASGGMFDAQLDAYKKTSAPAAATGGLAASDRNSKQRIAELESFIQVLGADPEASRGHMPLTFDTRDKIYRPFVADAPEGFVRNERPRAPLGVDPNSSYDSAALDEAYRREQYEQRALDATADAPAYTFKYKDADRFGHGQQLSQMAQDWEANPFTRHIVSESPDGVKMVDTGKLGLVTSAAVSQQQKQINEIEEEIKALRKRKSRGGPPADNTLDLEALDRAYARSAAAPEYGYPGQF